MEFIKNSVSYVQHTLQVPVTLSSIIKWKVLSDKILNYKWIWAQIALITTPYSGGTLLLHIPSCTGNLYCSNQGVKLLYKKIQIPNEQLSRAHLECASQCKHMWLCVETAMNMKFYNNNHILYDKLHKII